MRARQPMNRPTGPTTSRSRSSSRLVPARSLRSPQGPGSRARRRPSRSTRPSVGPFQGRRSTGLRLSEAAKHAALEAGRATRPGAGPRPRPHPSGQPWRSHHREEAGSGRPEGRRDRHGPRPKGGINPALPAAASGDLTRGLHRRTESARGTRGERPPRARRSFVLRPDGQLKRRRGQINIPPPKEPEVNPEVYRDVTPLIERGFITQAADINGALFVLRA